MTIRGKLTVMGAVVLVLILTMAGFTYVRAESIMNEFLNEAGIEVVVGAAEAVKRDFSRMISITNVAGGALRQAVTEEDFSDDDLEDFLVELQEGMAKEGVMQLLLGYESDGRVRTSTRWKTPEGYDVRTRPWYQEAAKVAKGQIILTEPYPDLETQIPVITTGLALHGDGGKHLAGLAIDMKLDDFQEFIVSQKIFGQGSGVMVAKSGLVAAHANKDFALKTNLLTSSEYPEGLHALARHMINGETGFMDYDFQGETRRVFYAPASYGFSICIFFPVSVISGMVRGLTGVLLLITVVVVLIAGALIIAIVRSLARTMWNMNRVMADLSSGNLSVRFDDRGRDELAHISGALNEMLDSIVGILSGIRNESDNTSRQAETLAALSEETLASMEEVGNSVESMRHLFDTAAAATAETNASISEIATSAQSSARSSSDGAEQATHVSDASVAAVNEVGLVLSELKEALEKSEQGLARIRGLERAVESISGFVGAITSIADQTNLLALNAAIEAARAGEAGRGFAVVAEEVRKLAEDSAQAASEVNKLIGELQGHSQSSVKASEETEELLTRTATRAEGTQQKLQGMLTAIERLSQAIQNIAAVSQEQAAATTEMETAMENVTKASEEMVSSTAVIETSTEETTRAAESIATEAQEMAETAHTLRGLVERFTFDDSSGKALAKHETVTKGRKK
ncbi:MAG: methyl-accepting chemotaxis protein [Fretibacterium sp.]|nr:methyl-accepting chemotaxis protein [Fretibacterium sp.]